MRDGSGRWQPSYWQELLRLTIEAVNSVPGGATEWSFGGGTALTQDLDHRISYDIDAFLESKLVTRLVPNVNPTTKRICWNEKTQRADYQWPGNYLKLNIEGKGEIDFLSVGDIVENPTRTFEFEGANINKERPAEIIAKKLRYRSSKFKPRDAFDLAAVYLKEPDELRIAAESPLFEQDALKRAAVAISMRGTDFNRDIFVEVNPTEFGATFISDAQELATEALRSMQAFALNIIEDEEPNPRPR